MDPYRATFGFDEQIRLSSFPAAFTAGNPKDGQAPLLANATTAGGIGPIATAGAYGCLINTQGVNTITVHLKPNAANAGGTPVLQAVMLDKTTARTVPAAVTGAAFASGVLQTVTLAGLAGCQQVLLSWTVTTSLDFSGAGGIAQAVAL
jgi:hypothetical protein